MAENDEQFKGLGVKLYDRFVYLKKYRRGAEIRWLEDLRQYRGVYEDAPESGMSQYFRKITRTKVKAIDSRLNELTFPAGSSYPWTLNPGETSDIEVNPEAIAMLEMQTGQPISPEILADLQMAEAQKRAETMKKEMDDQIKALQFRKVIKQVIHSGNLYGTGVMKGPLITQREVRHYARDPLTNTWKPQRVQVVEPYVEFVPVWEWYPDTAATELEDCDGVFQRHIKTRSGMRELARRPDFDAEVILDYVKSHADGDAQMEHFETSLRNLGYESMTLDPRSKRFEVIEFWGVIDARDLAETGISAEDIDMADEYWVNIWLLKNRIIKIAVEPIDGVRIPHFVYYYEKDETSIFGDGVPFIIRDDQEGLNASRRAMIDNAAVGSGPMLEANVDLLTPDEDPNAIFPRRVFKRNGVGVEAQYPAIRPIDVNVHTNDYMVMGNKFEQDIHESTVPSYMHGETDRGVGRTVGGLSMLMGTAQSSLKDQLATLEDNVIEPFLQALYAWNMQFNEKDGIRGDFKVSIAGTSSLVAKEVRAQALEQFAVSTNNPTDIPYVDRKLLNQERAKAQELPEHLIHDPAPMMPPPMAAPAQPQPGAPE